MFIAALFTIAKTWKQPESSSRNEWIKKMWHIYTMEYYSAVKRNEIELFLYAALYLNYMKTLDGIGITFRINFSWKSL